MIVVDTNVIASLVLPTSEETASAVALLEVDRDWSAPVLWRSEFCNILATGVRNRWLNLEQAHEALRVAEELMEGSAFEVAATEVLKTAVASRCTAYDSEFVVLARDLGVRLVTLDSSVLKAFPEIAVSLREFGGRIGA